MKHTCPLCEQEFENEKEFDIHYAQVHEQELVEEEGVYLSV